MDYSLITSLTVQAPCMRSKKILLSNFSHAVFSESWCLRPDNEHELTQYLAHHQQQSILTRGSGLSYNDSCFNTDGFIIDSQRFNHLINFDPQTGIAVCQGGVSFKDLFLLHPDFIPSAIPGTIHATIAGGIAHDVHGKNNHQAGSLGQHIIWFELLINNKKILCSREQNSDLFYATIAGLGLTGVITHVALRLKKASRFIQTQQKQFESLNTLIESMLIDGLEHNYQVAWLDLLNSEPRAILSMANHCESFPHKEPKTYTIPRVPVCFIRSWNMKLFNRFFFNSRTDQEKLSLQQFNNPLDKLSHWNRLYGPKGLLQFQAVFAQENAVEILEQLLMLIRINKATPTLAVLKLFTQPGVGLLSFCKPGFTLAVDFVHNKQARQAIIAMNQLITEINGRIYLAKDLLLNATQYKTMYTRHEHFSQILKQYGCNMSSDLAKRLGILK